MRRQPCGSDCSGLPAMHAPAAGPVKRAVAAFACLAVGVAGCEINRVTPTMGDRGVWPYHPTVIILSADATAWRARTPMSATFARVDENGAIAGGGCFLYDHTAVTLDPGEPGRRYFAFEAPAGVYAVARWGNMVCDDGACRGDGLGSGPWPKAFRVPEGEVVYLGDLVARPGNTIALERDLGGARVWAGDRFGKPPRLAQEAPRTPAAAPFLCTP